MTFAAMIVSASLGGLAASVGAAPGSEPVEWRLVWQDEFDGPVLDTDKWRAENAGLVKNEELQWYTPEAITVADGVLTIRAEKRPMGGRPYTSGLVETKGKFSRAFGRLEARIRIPHGQGLWPAWWALPEDGRWPPEIDMMEALGHQTRRIYTHHHWGVLPDKGSAGGGHELGPDYADDFHIYRADWFPDRIEWFIDDARVLEVHTHVPQDPFYLILNLAVGGDWPGNPDASTVFPAEMKVDYVRVYEPVEPGRVYLSTHATGGTIVPTRTVPGSAAEPSWVFGTGERATLRAVPDLGMRFVAWEGDGPWRGGTENPMTITMDAGTHVAARFEPDPAGPAPLRPVSVSASSTEKRGLEPEMAFDDGHATRWASAFEDNQWIAADLGEARDIEAVLIDWSPLFARSFRVQVSDDGVTWRDVHTATADRAERKLITGLDARARHVRVLCEKRSGRYGFAIWNLQIYGRTVPRE